MVSDVNLISVLDVNFLLDCFLRFKIRLRICDHIKMFMVAF